MNRFDINTAEVVDLYEYGFSQRELSRMLGTCQFTIGYRLKMHGVQCRPMGEPPKRGGAYFDDGRGYMMTSGRDKRKVTIHRGCWEAYHGPIPEGNHIHHVDGDRRNNEIENLQCMTAYEHKSLHGKRAHI